MGRKLKNMKMCEFCELDKNNIANTIIEETKNFYIKPSLGALVEGYLLIISKKHINSMLDLNEEEKMEYLNIIRKYRQLFFNKYNRFPIVFEHGSNTLAGKISASSIVHAHTHIVNHNYKNEKDILIQLNFKKINDFYLENNKKNYIFYINPNNSYYMSYKIHFKSQLMRTFIAEDLNMKNKYNWKKYPFTSNIIKTIKKFK